MGADRVSIFVLAAALLVTGCGDQRTDVPTSPSFGTKKTGCNAAAIQQLVSNEFTGSTRVAVNKLVNDMSQYRNAGDASNATYLGYHVLDSIATLGGAQGTPAAGSALAIGVLGCMTTGTGTIPDSFTVSLDDAGAFAVRGWPVPTDDPRATNTVISADGQWELQPPSGTTWNGITTLAVTGLADSVARLFLAYGRPILPSGFSQDALKSTVFEWETIPEAEFSPGVLVAECTTPTGYIQHNPVGSAEILGYVSVTCASLTRATERAPRNVIERFFRLFQPAPLLASALPIGSAGSKGTLSPFGKIDPVEINLLIASQPGKSGNSINRYLTPTVAVSATSKGGTGIGNSAFVWLEAYNNSGVIVKVCNNWAYTDETGVASFPNAYVNKAGGYTLVAKAASAAGAPALQLKAPKTTSLFNVKNSGATPPDAGCTGTNAYVSGPLPPPPGPPPVSP